MAVKPESPSGLHHFSPDDPPPSSRAAAPLLPTYLREAAPNRVRLRLRITWRDVGAPSGRREEIFAFGDARKLLDLLRRVTESPSRPVVSVQLEAVALPRWCAVDMAFVRSRAAQRERRDEIREVMRRRAAERSAHRGSV